MTHAIFHAFPLRVAAAILAGALLGGYLGYASAQDTSAGALDGNCAASCAAHGYDAAFCGQVCWIPDLTHAAEVESLDWKCMTECNKRGGYTRACMGNCRRR